MQLFILWWNWAPIKRSEVEHSKAVSRLCQLSLNTSHAHRWLKMAEAVRVKKTKTKVNDCFNCQVCSLFLLLDFNVWTTDKTMLLSDATIYVVLNLDYCCVIYRGPYAVCLLLITIMNNHGTVIQKSQTLH